MKKFWLPYPMWDMLGIELWLNEMAAQGWALGDWPRFTFIGRVPFLPLDWVKESRYRLDPINQWFGEQDLCRRAASYRDMGWRYVTQIGKLYAVYRCDDPEAPDLYTDRVSLGWAMKEFIRRQWGILAVTLVWAALMIGDHLSDPARLLMQTILRGPGLLLLSLMMLLLVGGEVVYTLAHTVRLTRIRKKLLQGELPGPSRRSTYRWPRFFLTILGTVVLALALMIQMIYFPHAQFQPLDGPEDWDCPHVLLSEVHPAGTESVQIKPGDEWKYSNYGSSARSWMAPELYRIRQADLARYPDGSIRDCSLDLEYIRTLSPELAHWVCAGKEGETWARYFGETNSLELLRQEELSSPGLDRLIHIAYQIENGEFPRNFYIGQSGCQVFVLHIQGPEPEKALDLLTERLAAEAV